MGCPSTTCWDERKTKIPQTQRCRLCNVQGSPQEKQARAYLAGLSIDYDALTKEEFVTLIGILQEADINRTRRMVTARARNAAKRKKDTEQVKNHLFRVFFVT